MILIFSVAATKRQYTLLHFTSPKLTDTIKEKQLEGVILVALIPLRVIAKELNMDRSNARKFICKHKFETVKARDIESGNQMALCVTEDVFDSILLARKNMGFNTSLQEHEITQARVDDLEKGLFYIIRLVPDIYAQRIKIGFTTDINSRLSTFKTTSPAAEIVKTWKCIHSWEACAIRCATREDCVRHGQEVYDFGDIDKVVKRLDAFFFLLH